VSTASVFLHICIKNELGIWAVCSCWNLCR
jgi:hypothetical protein